MAPCAPTTQEEGEPALARRASSAIRSWEGPGHRLIQSVKNVSVDRLCKSLCIKGEAGPASKPGLLSAPQKKKSEPDVARVAGRPASPAAALLSASWPLSLKVTCSSPKSGRVKAEIKTDPGGALGE